MLTDVAPAACSSSTKVPFSGKERYGISVQSYASAVYVKIVASGASDPSASSTLYTWLVPAGSSIDKKVGKNFDVWVQSSGNYSAQEWI